MIAYKLFRIKKNGDITSLFINKSEPLRINEWMKAKNYPTRGFAGRPGWHCTHAPSAPHLSMVGRKWFEVWIEDYEEIERPGNQGGKWYIAKWIRIEKEVSCISKT